MTELKQYTLNVTGNDIDPDGSIDPNSVTIVNQPSAGQVSVLENGQLSYSPNSDFKLTDSFTYSVSDMNGQVTNPATVDLVYIPPLAISFSAQSRNSVVLAWTHEAPLLWLNVFEVQKREQGAVTWETLPQLASDKNSLTVIELDDAKVYEFRIRGMSQNLSTLWSNVLQSSLAPIAISDQVLMASVDKMSFNITNNDTDPEGQIDVESIEIVEGTQFGEVIIEAEGNVTYIPGSAFEMADSFAYVVKDSDGVLSNQVSVEIIYINAPVIDISSPTHNSVSISWSHEVQNALTFTFEIQRRITGGGDWQTVANLTDGETTWTSAGLQPETTYEFRLLGKYGDFKTAWSNTGAINTLSKPVETPIQPSTNESSGGATNLYCLILMLFLLISRRVRFI